MEKFSLSVDDTRKLSTDIPEFRSVPLVLDGIPQSPHSLSTSHTNVVSTQLAISRQVMHFSPVVMSIKELMNEKTR